jgi:hypothetical protein
MILFADITDASDELANTDQSRYEAALELVNIIRGFNTWWA